MAQLVQIKVSQNQNLGVGSVIPFGRLLYGKEYVPIPLGC